jgi:hypothetical protein
MARFVLRDNSVKLTERLKLERKFWEYNSNNNVLNNDKNMQQLILHWIVELILNNKQK